jgi:hypothetical protein
MKKETVETEEIKNLKNELIKIQEMWEEKPWRDKEFEIYGWTLVFLPIVIWFLWFFLTMNVEIWVGSAPPYHNIFAFFSLFIFTPTCIIIPIYLNSIREKTRKEFEENFLFNEEKQGVYSSSRAEQIKREIKRLEFNQNKDFNISLLNNFAKDYELILRRADLSTPKKYANLTSIEEKNKKTTNIPLVIFVLNKKFIYAFKAVEALIDLNNSFNDENLDNVLRFGEDIEFLTKFALSSVEVIDFDDIYYWKVEGQLRRDTVILGGGSSGGGISLGGAMLGGVLAGDAGMIIGGREKLTINPIYSEIEEKDERLVELVYIKGKENKKMVFPFSQVDFFKLNLPQKTPDFANISTKKNTNKGRTAIDENEFEIKINKLETLLSKKIITQEEFDKKRKELIDSL